MIDYSLFHECSTRIFPLLIHYWSIYSQMRHKYVPKYKLNELRRQLVLERKSELMIKAGRKSLAPPLARHPAYAAFQSTNSIPKKSNEPKLTKRSNLGPRITNKN